MSQCEDLLMTASDNAEIIIMDYVSGSKLYELKNVFSSTITAMCLLYSNNRKNHSEYIVAASGKGSLAIVSLKTFKKITVSYYISPNPFTAMATSYDSKSLLCGNNLGNVYVCLMPNFFDNNCILSYKENYLNESMVNYASKVCNPKYWQEFAERVITPHNWSILHCLSIFDPEHIDEFYAKKIKSNILVDSYGKTPLHYLLFQKFSKNKAYTQIFDQYWKIREKKKDSTFFNIPTETASKQPKNVRSKGRISKYVKSASLKLNQMFKNEKAIQENKNAISMEHIIKTFDHILDFVQAKPYDQESIRCFESLRGIMPILLQTLNFPQVKRFFSICHQDAQPSLYHSLPKYGTCIGLKNGRSKFVLSSHTVINKYIQDSIFKEEAKNKITFHSVMLKYHFGIKCNEALSLLLYLLEAEEIELFDLPIVSVLIDYYWQTTFWWQFLISLLQFCFIGIYSVYVSLDYDPDWKYASLVFSIILAIYEILQLVILGFRAYFSNKWNSIDILGISLAIATIAIADEKSSESWFPIITILTLFFGYSRVVSHLRLFDSIRNLIRTIINIFYDMRSFIVILGIIIFASALMIVAMNQELTLAMALERSYAYLYAVLVEDLSVLEKILEIFFPFVMNVVFLNMLVNVMAKTFETTNEIRNYSDLKEKLNIIVDGLLFLRFFAFIKKTEKPKFLVYCQNQVFNADKNYMDTERAQTEYMKNQLEKMKNYFETISNDIIEIKEKYNHLNQRFDETNDNISKIKTTAADQTEPLKLFED